jgi:hypothetical protein
MRSAVADPGPAVARRPIPLTIRVLHGDIGDAQSSMIVVGHQTGLAPAGAAAAIDDVLGGAISRRAALLRGRFGTPWFLPTTTSPLATGCVVVILLGEPEYFRADRIGEIGTAIVDAADLTGVRDVATVLHGAGLLGVDPEHAATMVVSGVLARLARDPALGLRELSIVERDAGKLSAVLRGVYAAEKALGPDSRIEVFVEEATIRPRRIAARTRPVVRGIPQHLRLGITRSNTTLKVTTTRSDAVTSVSETEYPAAAADDVLRDLESELLEVDADGERRDRRFAAIGAKLGHAFVDGRLDLAHLLAGEPGKQVVLALGRDTVDLPWELLRVDDRFVALTHCVGRHVELPFLGRQSARPEPKDDLQILVIGDPRGDLPAARREAHQVHELLHFSKRATVTAMIFDGTPISYKQVSRALDTTDFDVLHFAGHGRYDPLRENQSGLELGDRVLTADDLADRQWVPRLIIANACHSAATGPAVPGVFDGGQHARDMVQQMLTTGTRTFIGAMWPVGDEPAAVFAEALYRALLGTRTVRPSTVGEAVRRARVAVRDRSAAGDPTWAAYALYGNPWADPWPAR